jgi:hypothetical protein
MSEQLDDFLVGLATNPQSLAEFQTNPAAAMKTVRLTHDERRALLTRDAEALRQAIRKSAEPTQVNNAPSPSKKTPPKKKPTKKKSAKK